MIDFMDDAAMRVNHIFHPTDFPRPAWPRSVTR